MIKYNSWSSEEDNLLIELYGKFYRIQDIPIKFEQVGYKRSVSSINQRLVTLRRLGKIEKRPRFSPDGWRPFVLPSVKTEVVDCFKKV